MSGFWGPRAEAMTRPSSQLALFFLSSDVPSGFTALFWSLVAQFQNSSKPSFSPRLTLLCLNEFGQKSIVSSYSDNNVIFLCQMFSFGSWQCSLG